jgi:hypothetical protein
MKKFYLINNEIRTEVFEIREIDLKNFDPAVHKLINNGLLIGCVQVLINYMGENMWITVREKDIRESNE